MFGRKKKPAPTAYNVNVDFANSSVTFKTLDEVNKHVLDLIQNGITMNDINVEDSNGKPYYLTAVSFTA